MTSKSIGTFDFENNSNFAYTFEGYSKKKDPYASSCNTGYCATLSYTEGSGDGPYSSCP